MPEDNDPGVIRAAGAVVWRPGPDGPQVALVHRPRYDDWSFPKGKREPGEHLLQTAIREVAEETGLRVVLGRPLRPSVYRIRSGTKQVSYWVARCAGQASFASGEEVDQLAWLPAADVADRLSYQRDVALAEEFGSAPPWTTPIILLRHAQAGSRSSAGQDDLARPLDASGVVAAELLAGLLSCYGPCRVISSPAERCVATVRPYAAAAGVPVEIEPALSVQPAAADAPGARVTAMAGRVAGRAGISAGQVAADLAAAGGPALVCAHRENLPVLFEAACHVLGADRPDGDALPKGGFWVLQSADGALVSVEQHDLHR
jgi:8-oxo-(d)GTP phosphatase